jgi:hypothetical protein
MQMAGSSSRPGRGTVVFGCLYSTPVCMNRKGRGSSLVGEVSRQLHPKAPINLLQPSSMLFLCA